MILVFLREVRKISGKGDFYGMEENLNIIIRLMK